MKYTCDRCEKPADKLYTVEDEGFCEKCFNRAVERAELAYEAQREQGES